ncbi:MAG: PqqD family protein [Clostridia bacterium]|nr:PqqD family protein [Clostridia bacterium]
MVRVEEGFVVCEVGGQTVAVASGALSVRFNGMITLNPAGKLLFECLQKGSDEEALAQTLVLEYGIDETLARRDVEKFLEPLKAANVLIYD